MLEVTNVACISADLITLHFCTWCSSFEAVYGWVRIFPYCRKVRLSPWCRHMLKGKFGKLAIVATIEFSGLVE